MKEFVKNTIGLITAIPLGSIAMQGFSSFSGSLAGIGQAGSALVGTGLLGQAASLLKKK